jgi:hypothetical protein
MPAYFDFTEAQVTTLDDQIYDAQGEFSEALTAALELAHDLAAGGSGSVERVSLRLMAATEKLTDHLDQLGEMIDPTDNDDQPDESEGD